MSRTTIELDDKAIEEALRLTHFKTKKEVVNYALEDLVKRLKRKKMLDLEGKVKWEGDLAQMRKART